MYYFTEKDCSKRLSVLLKKPSDKHVIAPIFEATGKLLLVEDLCTPLD